MDSNNIKNKMRVRLVDIIILTISVLILYFFLSYSYTRWNYRNIKVKFPVKYNNIRFVISVKESNTTYDSLSKQDILEKQNLSEIKLGKKIYDGIENNLMGNIENINIKPQKKEMILKENRSIIEVDSELYKEVFITVFSDKAVYDNSYFSGTRILIGVKQEFNIDGKLYNGEIVEILTN